MHQRLSLFFHTGIIIVPLIFFTSCDRPTSNQIQGYVEGDYLYISSPLSGKLESLSVERGQQVSLGNPLFVLESTPEKIAVEEAEKRLVQARASLEDVKKGKRPSEIESIQAELKRARAALALSEKQLERQKELSDSGVVATEALDRSKAMMDQDVQRVALLEADLETAQLGARSDQITAAQANVEALEEALARARWNLSQKSQTAPQDSLIFDTLYHEGEWVAAGQPVVVLLPPQNIKVRAFIPEGRMGSIHHGDKVQVIVDGIQEPFIGNVSFISPHAEYTPPVIYSQENRSKLVFMIEINFDPGISIQLNPGQPVDVRWGE